MKVRSMLVPISALMLLSCKPTDTVALKELAVGAISPNFVRVTACIETTRHNMTLVDCSTPEHRVAFEFAPGVENTPNAKMLLQLGFENLAPSNKRTVKATVDGKLAISAVHPGPDRVLVIHSVRSATATATAREP